MKYIKIIKKIGKEKPGAGQEVGGCAGYERITKAQNLLFSIFCGEAGPRLEAFFQPTLVIKREREVKTRSRA